MCSAKVKFVWHEKEQKAFEDIKAIISRETFLAYPDFSKDFHVYTDSSDYQLGAVIMQDDRPLAFYSIRERRPVIIRELFLCFLKNYLIDFLQNKTLNYNGLEKYVQVLTK